jgi:hypothetical protein
MSEKKKEEEKLGRNRGKPSHSWASVETNISFIPLA